MENRITIKFEFIDEDGSHFSSSSELNVFEDFGRSAIEMIGEQLNTFLRQLTYSRPNNYIFMEDVNEEEYDAIDDFLRDYRNKHTASEEQK